MNTECFGIIGKDNIIKYESTESERNCMVKYKEAFIRIELFVAAFILLCMIPFFSYSEGADADSMLETGMIVNAKMKSLAAGTDQDFTANISPDILIKILNFNCSISWIFSLMVLFQQTPIRFQLPIPGIRFIFSLITGKTRELFTSILKAKRLR